jgi:hypothetical protein
MVKRFTDSDAFAGGIAAYAMMQSLLRHLEAVGTSRQLIIGVIEDAAHSIELVSKQVRPRHPAMARAVLLLRGSAARWRAEPTDHANEIMPASSAPHP